MSSPHRPDSFMNEKAAWLAVADAMRRNTTGWGEAQEEPDSLLLAAWLEGRLDETEAAPVERWIAQDPAEATARIAALRETLAQEPAPAPNRLLLRLRAMAPRRTSVPSVAIVFWRRLPQAAAMAAAVTIGVFGAYGGYELGMSAALAQEQSEAAIQESALSDFDLTQEDFFFE